MFPQHNPYVEGERMRRACSCVPGLLLQPRNHFDLGGTGVSPVRRAGTPGSPQTTQRAIPQTAPQPLTQSSLVGSSNGYAVPHSAEVGPVLAVSPTRQHIVSLLASGLVLLALCTFASTPARSQTSEDQVATHFRAGQDAMRQAHFDHAVEEFKQVLALDPGLLEAEVNLGLAYHSLSEYDLAVRHLTKGLAEKPNLLIPNVIVGTDLLKLGSPAKAVPYLQRALKLDPSNREARQALASSYLSQENFRSAAEQFRQLAALDPEKSEAWFKLGHEYLDLSARLAYRGAHLYRESAWGHRFLGDLLFQRSRWDEAAREYRKALSADPRQSGLHTSVGQAFLHAGKLQEAEAEFHLELQPDSANELAWLRLAETALQQ